MGKKQSNYGKINHVTLQQIRNDKKTMSTTAIAKKYKIGYAAAKNASVSKSLSEFKRLMTNYNANEAKASQERRKAKKQNNKAQAKAADKVVANAQDVYTPQQVKLLIGDLIKHTQNLEERLQTVVSLLVESDDNVVTRLYKLENSKSVVRRFLERF